MSLVEHEPEAPEVLKLVESRVARELVGRVMVVIVDVEVVAVEVSKSIGSERTRQLSEIVADATDPEVRWRPLHVCNTFPTTM